MGQPYVDEYPIKKGEGVIIDIQSGNGHGLSCSARFVEPNAKPLPCKDYLDHSIITLDPEFGLANRRLIITPVVHVGSKQKKTSVTYRFTIGGNDYPRVTKHGEIIDVLDVYTALIRFYGET